MAPAGDANSDRLADLVVGAPQFFGTNDFGYASLFYGQGQPATGLQIVITPVDPPVVLPPEGGRVRFVVEILNRSSAAVEFELWRQLEPPGGGVLTGSPRTMTLGPGQAMTIPARQRIPAGAPPGTYTLRGLVGTFPVADDSDTFTFQKRPAS